MNKLVTFLMLLLIAVLFAACELPETEINYKGQLRPLSEAEEIIADELEVENPGLDLEVTITEESED